MEESRGAKLTEIIKQLGLNESVNSVNDATNGRSVKVSNVHRISARGKGLKFVPVKRPVTFTLRAPGFEQDDICIIVTGPSGREIPTRIDTIRSGAYEVEYITPEIGDHIIEVLACGKAIPGSPFHSSGYDASRIRVKSVPNGIVGQPVELEIDGSEAGSGNLEILVNGGHVTSEVRCLGDHRFLASFVPHSASTHKVEMKFNDDPVPGSPWMCEISLNNMPSSPLGYNVPERTSNGAKLFTVQVLENFPVSQTQFFDVTCSGKTVDDLIVSIIGPGTIPVQHRVVNISSDKFRVYFTVSVVGTYSFEVYLKDDVSSKQYFNAKAYDTNRIQVSDVPQSCCLNENCTFQVDASRAGEGQLEIAVNDGDVPNQVVVQGNGKCQVSFKPESTLPHVVDIKFNGQNVPGCPFTVEISDSSQFSVDLSQLELIAVGRICKFKIESKTLVQRDTIRVIINSPTGKLLPVTLSYGDVSVSCEFHPIEVGPHTMIIEHRGQSISSGQFFIKTYDSSKVIVTPAKYGCVGKAVQFIVDAGNSGEGNLEIAVNAKGINVMTQVHPMGGAKFGVSFTPSEVCDHTVFVTFNNEPVPGSPFTVSVGADMDTISVSGTAINFAPVDTTAIITIHNVTNERDLHVKIETPDGHTLPSTLKQEINSSNCTVEFLPRLPGEHQIHLHYQGKDLPGSPFATKVYNIKDIVVKEMPSEIIVGKPVTFLVEATNAGPGNLEVIVNNGKVPSSPQALGPSQYAISFVPKDAETHFIEIRFNGEPISGSPFICNVIDASKMILKKEGLDRIPVQSVASFTIDTKGASFSESSISIMSPNERSIKPIITGDRSNGFKVSFTPVDVGDHVIDVRIGDISLAPCPFLVKVYDAKNVKITDIGPSTLGKPVYFSIDASTAGAGNLEIIVSVNGKNVPNYVESQGNAKFRVNFKPTEPVPHLVSVKFNGEPVPGSPYVVNIIDSSTLNGTSQNSLKMTAIGKKVEFVVEGKSNDSDVKVIITNPIGRKLRANIVRHENLFTVSFVPVEVGPHQIVILVDGNTLATSPINCNVYDISRVRVTGLQGAAVNKPVTFQVDASEAGEGTLELVVTTKKTSVRAEVLMKSRGLYDVTFIPLEKVPHFLNIQFNEEDVIGSPFKIDVKDTSVSSGKDEEADASVSRKVSSHQQKQLSGRNDTDTIHMNGHGSHKVSQQQQYASGLIGSANVSSFDWPMTGDSPPHVQVTGPNGSLVESTVKLEGATLSVEYTPKMVGLYKIEALKDGKLVTKKPFLVEVVDPSKVKLIGVSDGVIGREQTFKVDSTKAGKGEMTINIKCGDKQVAHLIKEISSGVYNVTFVPLVDRPHYLDVRFNRYHIPNCPQLVEIRDPKQAIIVHGDGLKYCSPNVPTAFLIETGGFAAAKDFDVIITDPKGSPLSVRCYQQQDGSLLAEYLPVNVGSHKIEVSYLDAHVSGSPFTSECFDASKVIMDKIKSTNYSINEKIIFSLTRKAAGYAELDVTVTSPLGRHLPIEVIGTADGEGELIEFIPTVVGKYKIAITFGGIEIPGSPITFLVADANFPRVEGLGLKQGFINEMATFTIDARGLFGLPEVKVESVDTIPKVTIVEDTSAAGLYKVSYLPTEVGVFDVHVIWNGKPVDSSPFHPCIVNLRKIRPIGGWENLFNENGKIIMSTMEEKRISFDSVEAGPGKLRATIKSPDGETHQGNIEQISSTKFRLSMVFKKSGEHLVSLYFADHLLPSSPLICNVTETSNNSDGATVVLRGHGLAGARVGEETEFIIDGTDTGAGEPEVSLTGVKADIAIKLTKISPKVFKATYTAYVPGTYLLNALWAGKQVKGCPLKVSILPRCDAARVNVSGEGLKGGAIGRDLKVYIDTTRAGPGELTAHCVGPQRVAHCELIDQLDGTFYLFLKPQESGRHTLTIKYGGEHVNGSPFNIRVAGAPDPSRVRVYGPGIEHGVLPLYQSRFICDTRGAGAGQLTVRIRGPKGAFRVEMQRESQKDRTILCKYDPTEPGDYRIEVKWSGEHVPGSPFCVMIFDTQDELSRFLSSHNRNSLLRSNGVSQSIIGVNDSSELFSLGPMSWRDSVAGAETVFHNGRKD